MNGTTTPEKAQVSSLSCATDDCLEDRPHCATPLAAALASQFSYPQKPLREFAVQLVVSAFAFLAGRSLRSPLAVDGGPPLPADLRVRLSLEAEV
jgi:hypothetical protein